MPSKTRKQARMMAMAAHDPNAAKRLDVPQSVARDFNKSDRKTGLLKKAMRRGR